MRIEDISKIELEEIMARILSVKKVADDSLEIISKQRIRLYEETEEEFKKVIEKVGKLRLEAEIRLENLFYKNIHYMDEVVDTANRVNPSDGELKKAFLQKEEIYKKTQTILSKFNDNINEDRAALNVKFEEALAYKNKVYKEVLEKVKETNNTLYQSVKAELEFKY